ncbi:MAG TPA: glycosyltransferase [Baekduia sp.]|nr:glycosyltransferase [Baekduia sp.]
MRILVTSTLYPPVVLGGYERECAIVVDRLREEHEVLVLTSDYGDGKHATFPPYVRPAFTALSPDARGALRAPVASVRAVRAARAALAEFRPDFVYAWNGSSIPHAALRVLADSGTPMAFRVCEHWFAGLFTGDQYLRELLPAPRSPARRAWAGVCQALNAAPGMRLDPLAPFPAAISWITQRMRAETIVPPAVQPVLERVRHAVPRSGERYATLERAPAPRPEIAFIGRVTAYKGLDVAVEALALLRAQHGIEARLVVAGPEDAGHAAEVRAQADARGVAGAVDWLGPQDSAGIERLLARTHAVIVPSVWDEPLGLVPIEAAFARVPVVASDVGGIGEAMRGDEHALLFPPGDAAAAAAALARTLTATEETAARVARARTRADDFRLQPYLDEQARFVRDAHAQLRARR